MTDAIAPATDEEMAGHKARALAATPGPWELTASGVVVPVTRPEPFDLDEHAIAGIIPGGWPDSEFIAGANPVAILAIDARDAAQRAEIERLRKVLARIESWEPATHDMSLAHQMSAEARAALEKQP